VGKIFLSHSSLDNTEARAMYDWLATQGWDEVFFDLDPSDGLAAGQNWRGELHKAGENCSAVIILISPNWVASNWCKTEFLFAAHLGKEIFPVLIAPCSLNELPGELQATYQFADISTPEKHKDGLERLRIGLQRAGLHPGAFPWPPQNEPDRPPFRGLRVLEEPDAAIFFGRDTQITKALDDIRQLREGAPERMLVILGASGAGKSSFLRAGLLARLKRDTERFLVLPTLRPGMAPLTGPTGLRHALGMNGPLDCDTIGRRLAELRVSVVEHLGSLERPQKDGTRAAPTPLTFILPIDQAEELFVAGDEEAAAAVTAITEAVEADPNLLLLLTIRSDSFSMLQGNRLLSAIPRRLFDLPPLPANALKEIIEGPTGLPSVDITIDPELSEQLISDFEGGDALPLLAFTLERLITDHCTNRQLSKHTYLDEMKGVGGAIRKAVELAFAKAAEQPELPTSRAELDRLAQRSFVPGLVRIDDSMAEPKRRVALRRRLLQEALPLIDLFVEQRLLVADTKGTEPTIEVSHEAVLRHWRELAGWIAEKREDLILSERVTAAACDWQAAEGKARQEILVHRGERLRAAEKLLEWEDLGWGKDSDQVAYLAACRAEETRLEAIQTTQQKRQQLLRKWVTGLVAAGAIITLAGSILVVKGQRNLGLSQSLTLARTAEGFAEDGNYLHGLRLSILASHHNLLQPSTPEAMAALASNAQGLKLYREIRGHGDAILGALLSKDESRVLTWNGETTARLWDVVTGEQIVPSLEHDGPITGALFSNNGNRILTWSLGGGARLWNAANGESGPSLDHDLPPLGASFSKDDSKILTWSSGGIVHLWDTANGVQIGEPLYHNSEVSGALFSNDEKKILSWCKDGSAHLWDMRNKEIFDELYQFDVPISGALFSKDDSKILTWSTDKTVRIWDTAKGGQIGKSGVHNGPVTGALFSKDENRVLTWSEDARMRLWSLAEGEYFTEPLLEFNASVSGALFSKDESRILTWSVDGGARLWSAEIGIQIAIPLMHDKPVSGAVFLEGESKILTWNMDGTVRFWHSPDGVQGQPLGHDGPVSGDVAKDGQSYLPLEHGEVISGALFSKDDSKILTWSEDSNVRLWDTAKGKQELLLKLEHDDSVSGAVFSNDENRILTWSRDNTAHIWDAVDGKQIGTSFVHDKEISGAMFSKDENRILTWSWDNIVRLWDIQWAMRNTTNSKFVSDLCDEKLVGPSMKSTSDPKVKVGVRHIDTIDTDDAPILRSREGEDVCAPPPTTWDTLKSLLWPSSQNSK
jgi:WD40 repeat protein